MGDPWMSLNGTVGRLDARYRGVDRIDAGELYDDDPALSSCNHSLAPAINEYLRDETGFETDLQYNLFGPTYLRDRSGHMMYLRSDDLVTSREHIREFIDWSTPEPGTEAKW